MGIEPGDGDPRLARSPPRRPRTGRGGGGDSAGLRGRPPGLTTSSGGIGRAKTYVFFCEVGLKNAHLAELLHAAGGRAHHVEGGRRRVVRFADRQDDSLTASPALLSD